MSQRLVCFAFILGLVFLSQACGDDAQGPDGATNGPDNNDPGPDLNPDPAPSPNPDPNPAPNPDQDPDAPTPGAPRFAGLIQATSHDAGAVSLSWFEAADDTTAPADIRYLIFVGDEADPRAEVVGETVGALVGLEAGQPVALTVVAEDEDGERSDPAAPMVVEVATEPLNVRQEVLDFTGEPVSGVSEGDLVVMDFERGRSLRKVTAVGDVIETRRASLSDAIATGEMNAVVALPEPPGGDVGQQKPGGFYRRALEDPASGMVLVEEGSRRVQMGPDRPKSDGEVAFDQEVTLDYGVDFEPSFDLKARWRNPDAFKPSFVRAVAKGKFTLSVEAGYEIEGRASYKKEKELFKRTLRFVYTIGPVPVYQEVELKMVAAIELEAEAGFEATAQFEATKEVAVGFQWSEESGYRFIREEGFEQSFDYELEGEVTAKATVKIYPVLKTTLYKIASAELRVEPTLEADIKARLAPTPVEFTKFDLTFFAEAQAKADLTVFGLEIASWESEKVDLLRIPLHSLPEIALRTGAQYTTCRPHLLALSVTDGANNAVQSQDITWSVEGADLEVTAPDNILAFLSASEPGTYTVTASASGDGFLGSVGRRTVSKDINVVEVDCDELEPGPGETPSGGRTVQCEPFAGALGLTGPIRFSKNRIYKDESADLFYPVFLDGASNFVRSELRDSEGRSRAGIIGQGSYPDAYRNTRFGFEATESELQYSVGGGLLPPGTYHVDLDIQNSAGACDAFPDGHNCISYGLESPDDGSYTVYQQTNLDPAGCSANSGLPVARLEIVSELAPRDQNVEPKDAVRIRHGVRHTAPLGGPDDITDFYRVDLDPSSPANFDAALLTPECGLALTATSTGGTPGLSLYPTAEDAEADTNLIATSSGTLRLPEGSGEVFAKVTGRLSVGESEVLLEEACVEEVTVPALTGPPILPDTAARGEVIEVELPVNALTNIAIIYLVQITEGFSLEYGSVQVERSADEETFVYSFTIPNFTPLETMALRARLFDESFYEVLYTPDLAFSDTHYTARTRQDGSSLTDIPLGLIEVRE